MQPGIREFFEEIGLRVFKINERDGEVVIYCPMHDDISASLNVNVETGLYHDFGGCMQGAGLGNLLRTLNPDLGSDWEARFRARFPFLGFRPGFFRDEEEQKDPNAHPDIDIKSLKVADSDMPYFDSRPIKQRTLVEFSVKYHKVFDALVVPVWGLGGDEDYRGYVLRYLSKTQRYYNGLDVGALLFPINRLQLPCEQIILVEGVFDAIRAHQEGYTNCLSTFGGRVTEDQARLLGQFTRNIVLCSDRDAEGVRFTERNTTLLQNYGYNILYTRASGGAKDLAQATSLAQLNIRSYYDLKAARIPLRRFILN